MINNKLQSITNMKKIIKNSFYGELGNKNKVKDYGISPVMYTSDMNGFNSLSFDELSYFDTVIINLQNVGFTSPVFLEYQEIKSDDFSSASYIRNEINLEHAMLTSNNIVSADGTRPIANISNKSTRDMEKIIDRALSCNIIDKFDKIVNSKRFVPSALIYVNEGDYFIKSKFNKNNSFDLIIFKISKIKKSLSLHVCDILYNYNIEMTREKDIVGINLQEYYKFISSNQPNNFIDVENIMYAKSFSLNPGRKTGTNVFFRSIDDKGRFAYRTLNKCKKKLIYNRRTIMEHGAKEDIILASYFYNNNFKNHNDIIVDGFIKELITENNLHMHMDSINKFKDSFLDPYLNIDKLYYIIFKGSKIKVIGFVQDEQIFIFYKYEYGEVRYYKLTSYEINNIEIYKDMSKN